MQPYYLHFHDILLTRFYCLKLQEASELYKNLVKKYSTESSVDPFGKQRGRDSKELRNTKVCFFVVFTYMQLSN